LRGVDVTDADGEGVGGVGRLGCAIEREQAGNHELDLLFRSEAVAGDGRLDGERGILGYGEVAGGGSEHGNSADLAKFESGFCVGREEYLFDGDAIRGVERHHRDEFGIDLGKALRGLLFLVEADGSGSTVD